MINSQTRQSPWIAYREIAAQRGTGQPAVNAAAEIIRWKPDRPWFTKVRIMLPLAVIVMIVIVQAVTAWNPLRPMVAGAPNATAAAAGIGTKVRDAPFEFVVTGVERPGKTFPGKNHTTLTASGEFVVVWVDVTNLGDEARRLDCQCQYLLNDKGQAFEPSSAILYTKDALKFVRLINPGTTVKGAPVVFDVPPRTKIVSIELHQSSTSKGVQVKLS